MNTFNITDFYKRCDALVRDWQYKKTPNNDPFLTKEKSSNVLLQKNYWNLMPEPFWGNPENCYAVIINLNPGYSKYDKEYIGRDVITKKLRNGYSDFAITNPYFIDASFHPAATAWWSNRLNWMHKAFGCFNDPRYPFMLELCPWHSKKWAETGITTFTEEQKEYIKQNVLAPAAFASKENNRPIISIGKAEKIYQQLGFKLVKFWGPGKHKGPSFRHRAGRTRRSP